MALLALPIAGQVSKRALKMLIPVIFPVPKVLKQETEPIVSVSTVAATPVNGPVVWMHLSFNCHGFRAPTPATSLCRMMCARLLETREGPSRIAGGQ